MDNQDLNQAIANAILSINQKYIQPPLPLNQQIAAFLANQNRNYALANPPIAVRTSYGQGVPQLGTSFMTPEQSANIRSWIAP